MNTSVNARHANATDSKPVDLIGTLQGIKFGSDPSKRFKRKDLILMFRNLTTLLENGVSLPHGLETVASDPALKKYSKILNSISRDVRGGRSLSGAMKKFPLAFEGLLINQVTVGERSGALDETLTRITEQIEQGATLKSFIIKKLTYPAILVVAGIGSVTFMLLCVIPTFQEMYEDSGATLPAITQLLIDVGELVRFQGLYLLGALGAIVAGAIAFYKNPETRQWLDRNLLRVPVLGKWFCNMAMLQFMDVLGNLMESGFTLAEALPLAGRSVNNRHVRDKVLAMNSAIRSGERFSSTLATEDTLFPPVVKQLVIVGERTGRLAAVTRQIRVHIRRDVDYQTNAMVGAIEPILTAGLAFVVGGILLAVYLPMFDMIGQTN